MSDLGYNPLVYMWIVEFTDGTALPQFDPETGQENKADPDWLPSNFGIQTVDIDTEFLKLHVEKPCTIERPVIYKDKTVRRFGWYPFSFSFASKILQSTGLIVIPTNNPIHVVDVPEGKKLIATRENTIQYSLLSKKIKHRETVYCCGFDNYMKRISERGEIL